MSNNEEKYREELDEWLVKRSQIKKKKFDKHISEEQAKDDLKLIRQEIVTLSSRLGDDMRLYGIEDDGMAGKQGGETDVNGAYRELQHQHIQLKKDYDKMTEDYNAITREYANLACADKKVPTKDIRSENELSRLNSKTLTSTSTHSNETIFLHIKIAGMPLERIHAISRYQTLMGEIQNLAGQRTSELFYLDGGEAIHITNQAGLNTYLRLISLPWIRATVDGDLGDVKARTHNLVDRVHSLFDGSIFRRSTRKEHVGLLSAHQ